MSATVERAASDASAPAAEVVCCVGTERCARHLTLVALHVMWLQLRWLQLRHPQQHESDHDRKAFAVSLPPRQFDV
jgi:hypothetical protein